MANGLELAAQHDAAGRHEDAINALAVATKSGDIDAMTELSKRLIVGDRAPYLPAEGASLLNDAARQGSSSAQLCLACLTALGAHVPQSWGAALGLLVEAAERGSRSAADQLRLLARADDPPRSGASASDYRGLARAIDVDGWFAPCAGITLHDDPLVRQLPDLLPPELCRWLIAKARGRLRPALIYSGESSNDIADEMRTNSVAVWNLGCMDLVNVVLQYRIAAACGVPIANLEAPTALHYKVGEQITNHYDFLNPSSPSYRTEIATRGERVITFLTYLNDDYAGGETDFPRIGVRHKGQRGCGLFFRNAHPTAGADARSLHAGRPPTSGEKWLVSQFIRSRAVFNTQAENVG
ncbi:MAG TPA: 2OG-Fe(II) oxygenase [Gammaproteobacteria bacterium]|nr:2OG-Fe(II) oxygenase [Gammaproteobacteria bacterium]